MGILNNSGYLQYNPSAISLPCSVSMWVKPSSTMANPCVLASIQSTNSADRSSMRIYLSNVATSPSVSLKPSAKSSNSGGTAITNSGQPSLGISTFDIWMHVAAVFDSVGRPTVYLNNVAAGPGVAPGGAFNLNTAVFCASLNNGSSQSVFKGVFAECAVWNIALSASDINSLYHGAIGPQVHPEALVVYANCLDWYGGAVPEYSHKLGANMVGGDYPVSRDHPSVFRM